ncbi:hypothetical protein AGABI1DRAFT_119047 [Agaricus bisporus var. burnettii JB137-S8]|uniref:Protein HGH1 homolog n=2 Tax=Agaricus bisporus var. burnettii TaxID=192524 RepID=K5XF63_AGABU|nr:uncharacterized protein AGABI1DRAFT_119047 [Agaricus bisporus var. burnettii JB137-S8]EKM82038.1 hypothetical protein AGABI1DRAFT_119047 [Agaricus bisporus var. burnettii JB137-S8]KAF7770674.1 hypothetical protein Agabi119p4_6648 [Agaricus bisporus var. burnettii]
MDAQLRELIPFLRDRNVQARALALEHLVQHTLQGSPHRNIFFAGLGGGGLQKPKENNVVKDLKILCRDQLNVAHDAFRALVNLSDSPLLISPLSEISFINFLVSYIINPQSILADLASMLLSNLTASSTACSILLSLKISVIPDSRLPNGVYTVDSRSASCPDPVPYPSAEPIQVPALPLLVDAFVQGATIGDIQDLSKRKRKGELHFLANVFANLTVSPIGRNYFLSPQPFNVFKPDAELTYPLGRIVAFTEHRDKIRRGGVASSIKNCAFLATGHKAILSPESDNISVGQSTITAPGIDALPYLLLPLAGPEEFDFDDQEKLLEPLQFLPSTKQREEDPTIRLTHIETLILLCHTRWGRDYLRNHGVYQIIRVTHEHESIDKVSEHIERLVQLIQGDEPNQPLLEGEDITTLEVDESQIERPSYFAPVTGVGSALSNLSTQSQGGGAQKASVGDEDEDDKIEEI